MSHVVSAEAPEPTSPPPPLLTSLPSLLLNEDLAAVIGPYCGTREIFSLPLVCSAFRDLASSHTFVELMGRALGHSGGDGATLVALLHRAAMLRNRIGRPERPRQTKRQRCGVPPTPTSIDVAVHRRLGFSILSRGLMPPPAEINLYRPYLAAVTAHPPPTRRQLIDFADYLSTAHSWYKHLSNPPGEPFLVYFDPSVMMAWERPANAYREIRRGETGCHYSTRTTEEYRQRFSICAYDQIDVPPRDDGGEANQAGITHVHDIDGTPLLVPPRIALGETSIVLLSTMCYQPTPMRRPMEEGALRNAAASLRARAARGSSPSLVAAAARLETLVEEIAGVDAAVVAENNGAVMAGPQKRRELLACIYDRAHRAERAAIVEALVWQAEEIWAVKLREE